MMRGHLLITDMNRVTVLFSIASQLHECDASGLRISSRAVKLVGTRLLKNTSLPKAGIRTSRLPEDTRRRSSVSKYSSNAPEAPIFDTWAVIAKSSAEREGGGRLVKRAAHSGPH